MSVLDEICARKREHIEVSASQMPLDDLKIKVKDIPPALGFIDALRKKEGVALIAEVKKASPSKGIIRDDFDPVEIARIYESAGAACISVLTDEPYFQGKDDYLRDIKQAVSLPVLRKDFMLEPYQIYESRALGADCILLIMAALEDSQAQELYELSGELGMNVLVEIHDEAELERSTALNPSMIGVNSRNLKTLEVDVATAHQLAGSIPDNVLKVAESGISSNQTIQSLQKVGYGAFLVGESLMRQENIAQAVQNLITK